MCACVPCCLLHIVFSFFVSVTTERLNWASHTCTGASAGVRLAWRNVIVNWLLEWVAQIHNSILYMYMHCSSCTQWIRFSISIECDQLESTRLDSTGINPTRFNAMQCDLSSVRFEWQNSLFLHPTNTHTSTHTYTVADIHACHTLHIAHSRSGQATQLSSWTICWRTYNNYFVSCRSLWL